MLEKLKQKFVLIVVAFVGLVLAISLTATCVTSYENQQELISRSLDKSLNGELTSVPTITSSSSSERNRGLVTLVMDVSSAGIILQMSDDSTYMSQDTLKQTVEEALVATADAGTNAQNHVSWKKRTISDSTLRIAIVDTTTFDAMFVKLVMRDVQIFVVALALVWAIAHFLAKWTFAPLEEAWKQQKLFIADASHELKTPLTVILANLDILSKDKDLSSEDRHWIQTTKQEAITMKSLVGSLLQLAQLEEGSQKTGMLQGAENFDFSKEVSSCALEFDPIAFDAGASIETTIEPNLMLKANKEWTQRLIKILLDNACKYAKNGSKIYVRVSKAEKRICFKVTNFGDVIDPEDLPHVFDRFYRSDKARKHTGDATTESFGLGLAIAKSICESCGGSISVTSDAQAGTTFTCLL